MKVSFAWYDLWVGAYWDRKGRVLYVCPLPTLLLTFGPRPTYLTRAERRAARRSERAAVRCIKQTNKLSDRDARQMADYFAEVAKSRADWR
jgi:hypothetical protein